MLVSFSWLTKLSVSSFTYSLTLFLREERLDTNCSSWTKIRQYKYTRQIHSIINTNSFFFLSIIWIGTINLDYWLKLSCYKSTEILHWFGLPCLLQMSYDTIQNIHKSLFLLHTPCFLTDVWHGLPTRTRNKNNAEPKANLNYFPLLMETRCACTLKNVCTHSLQPKWSSTLYDDVIAERLSMKWRKH